jgi:hypothetical protein
MPICSLFFHSIIVKKQCLPYYSEIINASGWAFPALLYSSTGPIGSQVFPAAYMQDRA